MLAWLAGLVIASAASWWIWRSAPAADELPRFAAALAPVIVWALVPAVLGRWMFGDKEGRSGAPNLRDQRRAVLRFLADRGLKGSRRRHSLPLYLVAGPSGSGKSALLLQSDTGLGLPVAVGASRWWVGQDAIFVETNFDGAGGSQDVFDLIRTVRPRQPMSATLLVISPADLTLADEAEHRAIADAIASDLSLLEERIGARPPLYLLLSKTDMVPGFHEFFDRLEPLDRATPWGFSLPLADDLAAGQEAADIDKGFDRLLSAMRARHVEWLSREADPVRSGRIHGFATQVAALRHQIKPIVDALLPRQTHAWQGAILRGVFLTSAHQEPLTIDSLLPDLSRWFALPRIGTLPPDLGMEDENHGYFIAGAFQQAILPEAGLVAAKRKPWAAMQWTFVAVMIVCGLTAGLYVLRVFDTEVQLAPRISRAAAEFPAFASPSSASQLPSVVAAIKRFDALVAEIRAEPSPPLLLGDNGRPLYGSALADARRNFRQNVLLPHLSALLETQLVDADADDAELKVLIAVAEAAAEPGSDSVRQWLEDNASLVPETDRETLVSEGIEGIREAGGLAVDPAYIDAARRMIAYRESLS